MKILRWPSSGAQDSDSSPILTPQDSPTLEDIYSHWSTTLSPTYRDDEPNTPPGSSVYTPPGSPSPLPDPRPDPAPLGPSRLRPSGIHRPLEPPSDDDEAGYTSNQSTSDSDSGGGLLTPPPSPDRRPNRRQALVLRPGDRLEVVPPETVPSRSIRLDMHIDFLPPAAAWLSFLDDEIASTCGPAGERETSTHRALRVLRAYLAAEDMVGDLAGRPDRELVVRYREDMAGWAAGELDGWNERWLRDRRRWATRFGDREDMEGFWWVVWGNLVEVVVRMGYEGDEMEMVVRLVGALLELGRRRRRRGADVMVVGGDGRKWMAYEIPTFKDIWAEAHPSIVAQWSTQATPHKWIASCSFLGRLTGAGLAEWWWLGVRGLDDALSGKNWRYRDPILDCYVLSAAEYIKHAGIKFARACAAGHDGLCLDFWDVWQARFARVTECLAEDPTIRAALEAQRIMAEIRASVDFSDLVVERMQRVLRKQARREGVDLDWDR